MPTWVSFGWVRFWLRLRILKWIHSLILKCRDSPLRGLTFATPQPPGISRCTSMEGLQFPIGTLKIIVAIEDLAVIAKILSHLGLSARAPPRSPARAFDLFQMA